MVTARAPIIQKEFDEWRGVQWTRGMPLHQRHLCLWKKWREPEYRKAEFLNPISEHFLEACRLLFDKRQLVIHPWFEAMAEAWTMYTEVVYWGAASSGKSHFLGLAVLMDYILDPQETHAMLASTTKDMLEMRSFASVVEFLGYLRGNGKFSVPFKFVRQKMTVMPTDADENKVLKAVIRGVAVQEGSQQEARAALQGVHLPYVRAVADELAAMRPAILDVGSNLGVCKDFKFVGASNPESMFDPCGQISVPRGGWGAVGLDTAAWDTAKGGRVLRFDAYKSPGIAEPEKYPFLPSQKTIDRVLAMNHGDADHPHVWTFLRAFPPPQGKERTLFTEASVKAYRVQEPVIWRDRVTRVAGVDPAFTADGDNAVMVTASFGYDVDGRLVLCYDPVRYLRISASDPRPVLQQLGDQIVEIAREEGIPSERLGIDDSGTQSVADFVEMALGAGVYRCLFNGKPPELPVSAANPASAVDRYRDKVTWMYGVMAEYARWGQLRGIGDVTAQQLCARRAQESSRLMRLESKKDLKKRTKGQSPDEADACAVVAGLVRERMGLLPGASEWAPQGAKAEPSPSWGFDPELVKKYNNL